VAASDRRSDLAAVPAPLAALLLLGIAPHHFLVVPPCQRRRSLADVCNELVIRDPSVPDRKSAEEVRELSPPLARRDDE